MDLISPVGTLYALAQSVVFSTDPSLYGKPAGSIAFLPQPICPWWRSSLTAQEFTPDRSHQKMWRALLCGYNDGLPRIDVFTAVAVYQQ